MSVAQAEELIRVAYDKVFVADLVAVMQARPHESAQGFNFSELSDHHLAVCLAQDDAADPQSLLAENSMLLGVPKSVVETTLPFEGTVPKFAPESGKPRATPEQMIAALCALAEPEATIAKAVVDAGFFHPSDLATVRQYALHRILVALARMKESAPNDSLGKGKGPAQRGESEADEKANAIFAKELEFWAWPRYHEPIDVQAAQLLESQRHPERLDPPEQLLEFQRNPPRPSAQKH